MAIEQRSRWKRRGGETLALVLCCALALMPLACGGGGDDGPTQDDEQLLVDSLPDLAHFTPVRLDASALARAVRAGQSIRLPFGREGGGTDARELQLTERNLRNPELTHFVLKDGDAGSGSSAPLPPPATYQGLVRGGGTAVLTITDRVVEGSMLAAPEGWSFIEPLEPQLRLRDVDADARQRLLREYDHIVYNTRDIFAGAPLNDDPDMSGPAGEPQPPSPLVMSMVADGEAALFRAYPLDSVMPFWLKQETLLNGVDWQYNCVESEANAENAYADCANDFDGGSNAFQARVRIDRLEVWTTGGPDSNRRVELLPQSISMTHQASPLCCGPPHTAGRSSLVHFFSGRDLVDGAGVAAGVGGINEYGPSCFAPDGECHHALSQIVPGDEFRGTAFHQQSLVTHEIGHNADAPEISNFEPVCWLFGEQCGTSLMYSSLSGFSAASLYVYLPRDAQTRMGPRLAERLRDAAGNNR